MSKRNITCSNCGSEIGLDEIEALEDEIDDFEDTEVDGILCGDCAEMLDNSPNGDLCEYCDREAEFSTPDGTDLCQEHYDEFLEHYPLLDN